MRTTVSLALLLPSIGLADTYTYPTDGDLKTLLESVSSGDRIEFEASPEDLYILIDDLDITLASSTDARHTLRGLTISSSTIRLENLVLDAGSMPYDLSGDVPDCVASSMYVCPSAGGLCFTSRPLCVDDATVELADVRLKDEVAAGVLLRSSTFSAVRFEADDVDDYRPLRLFDTSTSLTECTFSDNEAGAIYAKGGSLDIHASTFSNNGEDAGYGGDVYLDELEGTVSDSTFEQSTAVYGGSLFVDKSSLALSGSRFSDSEAFLGAALYGFGDADDTVTIRATEFIDARSGNAATLAMGSGDLSLETVTFQNPLADNTASAIYASDATVNLTDVIVVGHGVPDGENYFGAAMAFDESEVTISGLSVTEPNAAYPPVSFGGALGFDDCVASIANSRISGTLADEGGGGIIGFNSDLTVTGVQFTDTVARYGGAIAQFGGDFTSVDSIYQEGRVNLIGGAIDLITPETVTIRNSSFLNNATSEVESDAFAGAVAVNEPSGKVMVTNSTFCDNTSTSAGGGLSIGGSDIDVFLANNIFIGNGLYEAEGYGESVYLGNSSESKTSAQIQNNNFIGTGTGTAEIVTLNVPLDLRNNIVYGTPIGYYGMSTTSDEPVVEGGYNLWFEVDTPALDDAGLPGTGAVVEQDPKFVNYVPDSCSSTLESNGLWLELGSPARDAGDPTLTDPDGTRSDIGAFGGPASQIRDVDEDGVRADIDCNDTDPDVFPGQTEVCNGIDDNCDREVDEGTKTRFWLDADGDSFGGITSEPVDACEPPSAEYVTDQSDCDDSNDTVYPGAPEIMNDGVDQNCDGRSPAHWVAGTSCQMAPVPALGWLTLPLLALIRRRR